MTPEEIDAYLRRHTFNGQMSEVHDAARDVYHAVLNGVLSNPIGRCVLRAMTSVLTLLNGALWLLIQRLEKGHRRR